jgi:hypothetical protein
MSKTFTDQVERLSPRELQEQILRPDRAPGFLLPAVDPARLGNADLVLAGQLALIGETYPLPEGFSWRDNPSRDKEWQIAQHKHPFAVDLALAYRERGDPAYLRRWVDLLSSWLAEMGSGYISASDAQVEAKRIENWSIALVVLAGTPAAGELPPGLLRALLTRLAGEADYILAHLKPARNHRTFQLFSVFLAGALFPELRDARRLVRESSTLLTDNLLADILPDGVQVELSTHYHQLVLETATAFVALARWRELPVDPALLERLARGLEFSLWMQQPDGSIPLIGDSDNGDHRPMLALGAGLLGAPELRWGATLGRTGAPPAPSARQFAHSGYFVLGDGWGSDAASFARRQHVFYDCAQLGAGSHSHYDLFSFTYYAAGVPLVVDPGRYTYDSAPDADGVDWREQFKSTAYHNTVTIDGLNQTRYISKWRRDREGRSHGGPKHGPAPEILDRRWRLGEQSDWIDARAQSAEYTPQHRRFLLYMCRQYLLIVDQVRIDDRHEHECDLRFHVNPRWGAELALAEAADMIVARAAAFQICVARAPGLAARVEQGWVSKHYGVKQPAPVLSFKRRADHTLTFCSLVAPAGMLEVTRLGTRTETDEHQLRCSVEASLAGRPIVDELVLALGEAPAVIDEPDLHFRGRHLALRRQASGAISYICAHGAERLDCDGRPASPHAEEDVEWSQ